jgi:ribose transport system substrate-binding protein
MPHSTSSRARRRSASAGIAVTLLLAGCGSSSESDDAAATTAASADATATSDAAGTTGPSADSATPSVTSEKTTGPSSPAAPPTGGSPILDPFDPTVAPGAETGLPERVAFANNSSAPFLRAFSDNMQAAVEDRGMEFVSAVIEGNPVGYVDQLNQFLARGVGTLVAGPVDPAAQQNIHNEAIDSGVGMLTLVAAPAVMIGNTDQYAVGRAQGEAAARYITASLGGEAKVLLFNLDSGGSELQKRTVGVKDGLATAGDGVEIVADQEALTAEEAFDIATTALQANPDISVVLGNDSSAVGAYQAFEQEGMLTDNMYFGGIDGDPQAIELIREGGPFRTSHGFAWEVLGYAYGHYSADWIEGRSIPRVLLVPPVELTAETIETYAADMERAGEVFADETLLNRYLIRLGNTSFAERDSHWESEYFPPASE